MLEQGNSAVFTQGVSPFISRKIYTSLPLTNDAMTHRPRGTRFRAAEIIFTHDGVADIHPTRRLHNSEPNAQKLCSQIRGQ